jgi:transcriptional regulator GlxA family with amidase domain
MHLQAFECLWARHFMQQMTVDIEKRRTVFFSVDDMGVPQFVVESLCHGLRGWLWLREQCGQAGADCEGRWLRAREGWGRIASTEGRRCAIKIGVLGHFKKSSYHFVFAFGIETDLASPALTAFVKRSLETFRRGAAPCTGAFVLAEAGVLDDRRVTTHWQWARDLQRRFPKVAVEEDRIFIVVGAIWTSAGMAATIDMALAMIEKDFGKDLSRKVARKLVVYHQRAGGQPQFSALLALEPKSDRIQKAVDYAQRESAQCPIRRGTGRGRESEHAPVL